MPTPIRVLSTVTSALAALTLTAGSASALPGTDAPGVKGAFAGLDHSYPKRTTNQPAVLDRGLYVIGDSISTSPGKPVLLSNGNWFPGTGPRTLSDTEDHSGGATVAPYVDRARLSALQHKKSAARAVPGFTFHDHLTQYAYPSSPNTTTTSVQDARASNAGVVFVELGTNDLSCMWRTANMPVDPWGGIDHASRICDDPGMAVPKTAAERESVRGQIASDVYALVNALTTGDSTRCVMLGGLREVNLYGAKIDDYRWFNNLLRLIASGNANVKFGNFDLFWRGQAATNGPLWLDWNKRWKDYFDNQTLTLDVHPHTSKAAESLADWAVYASAVSKTTRNDMFPYGGCGLT